MTRAEQYRQEAERALQAGTDAQNDADALVLGKSEVSAEDQQRADEKYEAMSAAFKSARDWELRAQEAEKADLHASFRQGQADRNLLPPTEPAVSGVRNLDLEDQPTGMELLQRQFANQTPELQRRFSDVAHRRWPVEGLWVMALAESMKARGPDQERIRMTDKQRKAFATYQRNAHDARMAAWAITPTQKADTDNLGGVLVPEYLDRMIRTEAKYEGPFADDALITTLMMGSTGLMKLPRNTSINDDAQLPGYVAEATDVTPITTEFDELTLQPDNFAVQYAISDQLMLSDVISIEAFLARKVGENFGRRQNAYFTSGNGTNQPTGVTTVAKATRQVDVGTSGQIDRDDVYSLAQKLDAGYHMRPSTRWMVHFNTMLELMKLTENGERLFDRIDGGRNVVLPGGGPGGVLWNNRLYPYTATTADQIVAVLGDYREYVKVQVGGLRFETARGAKGLESFQTLLSWNTFLDGKPAWDSAFAKLSAIA